MIVIDGTDLILGKISAYVAKQSLLGETIRIVNAEKIVITGNPEMVMAKQVRKRNMGAPLIGPYYPRMPERIVKRTIRGMVPYKKPRGKEAFARIRCYAGLPAEFKNEKLVTYDHMNIAHSNVKYTSIEQISKHFGAKTK
ncbi:MAG: 50S ribosomal protein L13 [Candidatus Nanoarchaeia archaeon]